MRKNIDAVGLVRQIRDDIYERTKEMSAPELVEFFRRGGSSAKETIRRAQERRQETVKRSTESH
jgi:hypothetical protein